MTTKEKLLAAARSCLLRRGYASTTVREIIAESGANQASINYHFGSKDALLNQALFALNGEWGEVLFGVLSGGLEAPADHEGLWQGVIESILGNRPLWFLNFEAIALAQHDEVVREGLADRGESARAVLASVFGGIDPDEMPDEARSTGAHYYAVLVGVAMQWLIDPDTAPSAAQIAASANTAPG